MKKNVVFWIGVYNSDPHVNSKHGGFKYFEYSKKAWQYWCEKNDVIFYHYDKSSESDIVTHKPTWQRWFDIFKYLERDGIDYDKIFLIDSSTMVKWNAPNFFEHAPSGQLSAFRSLENLRWIYESSMGYSDLFKGFEVDLSRYINCGAQIFDGEHKKFVKKLKDFYDNNFGEILKLQNETVRKGTDQPVYNYLLQKEGVKLNLDLPKSFHLTHMARFDWFSHNWQLNIDKTPFFIKYGNVWSFSGFSKDQRTNLMKQTWDLVGKNYE